MAITDIKSEWMYAWDDGWGGEQGVLIMNLDGPANVLAQATVATYNPNDGGSYGQGYVQGYIANGHYVDATAGGTNPLPLVYADGVTSVWFTVNVLQGDVVCVANIFIFG
ncbi:MAG: hypothetical protein ACRDOU_23370 [Streptosporangiaceae bacterium]